MKHLIVSIALIIAGCSTADPFKTENGKLGYFITCPNSSQDCVKLAGELCEYGFDASHATTPDDDTHIGWFANDRQKSMTVICKPLDFY